VPDKRFVSLCATVLILIALTSCRTTETQTVQAPPLERSIIPEIQAVDLAAYPEGSYTVKSGDTPSGIAAKMGMDYTQLAAANAFKDDTVLKPGDVIIVPRVAERTGFPAGGADARAGGMVVRTGARPSGEVPQAQAPRAPVPASVSSDGRVHCGSAGTVSAVYRRYPGLGDVVIMESDTEKVIYSGTFTPSVAKDDDVPAGGVIGTAAAGGVKESRFTK
jgi:LysM repeat protein